MLWLMSHSLCASIASVDIRLRMACIHGVDLFGALDDP